MFKQRRLRQQRAIAPVILRRADVAHNAYETCQNSGQRLAVVLATFQDWYLQGWMEREWEDPTPIGRGRRAFYRLTPLGSVELRRLLDY